MGERVRRFPANDITWDNYRWAVRAVDRRLVRVLPFLQSCAALRRDAIEGRLEMTELVDPEKIEKIVGTLRHPKLHLGRADSASRRVFILHSEECRSSGLDLRTCPFSIALDRGIRQRDWIEDAPVELEIEGGRLVVARVVSS